VHNHQGNLGKYHTYNPETNQWELDDENLGMASKKHSGGDDDSGANGITESKSNKDGAQSFGSSGGRESREKVEIVSGVDGVTGASNKLTNKSKLVQKRAISNEANTVGSGDAQVDSGNNSGNPKMLQKS
jgi:hypothetical protein